MATTIGRVDFIVGLDGKNLPAQAKAMGKKIAAAGNTAGADYAKEFEHGFDANLSGFGDKLAAKMRSKGALAAHEFSDGVGKQIKRDFAKIQNDTEKAFSGKKAFQGFLDGFPSVNAGVNELRNNLKLLAQETTWIDEFDEATQKWKSIEVPVIDPGDLAEANAQLDKWAKGARIRETLLKKAAAAAALATADFDELNRTLKDTDAWDAAGKKVGGLDKVYEAFRLEIERVTEEQKLSVTQNRKLMDQLDMTRAKIEETTRKLKERIDKDHELALSMDRARTRTIRLDRATAALNRNMADQHSFDHLVELLGGDVGRAQDHLIRQLQDMVDEFQLSEVATERLARKIDTLADRHLATAQAAEHHAGKTHDLALQMNAARDRTSALDLAMADLHSRMGSTTVYRRYNRSLGGTANTSRDLHGRISALATVFKLPAKSIQALRNQVEGLGEAFEKAAASAASAGSSGGGGNFLKNFLGGKGGLSTGSIIVLVAGLLEPAMVAAQGLAAALSSLIGVLGAGLAGAAALAGPALAGLLWTLLHAQAALGMMNEEFPKAQRGMDKLKKAAENDSRAFARAWGPALAEFTEKLAQLWRDDKMGERAGEALGKVTQAFTGVLNSQAYLNFQTAMETTIPNSIANLGGAAASLTSGLLNIFAAAGPSLERVTGLLKTFTDTWAAKIQSQADSGELQTTIDGLVDDFLLLLDTVTRVWDATTKFFDLGRSSGRKLLDMIGKNFDKWSAWMDTLEGKNALEKFFQSGIDVTDSLLDQLPKLQRAFDKIVTPEAVERTTNLLDQLGDLAEGPLAEIIQAVGELDVFGTIATFLNDVLTPLKPLFDILAPLLGILSSIVEWIGRVAGAIFTILAPALIPLRFLWEGLNTVIEQFLVWSEPLFTAFEEMGTAISEGADAIWEALEPAIQDLYEAFLTLLPSPEELAAIIREDVIPSIQEVVSWITDKLIPKLSELIGWIADTIEAHGGWEQIMEDVKTAADNLKKWIETDGKTMFEALLGALEIAITTWDGFQTAINGVKSAFTFLKLTLDAFYHWFSGIPKWLSDLIGALSSIPGLARSASQARGGTAPSGSTGRPNDRAASGMLLTFPRRVLAGEAGPEAIVPLRRPLSMVDPSVRALSAYAQGLTMPGSGGGGGKPAPSKVVNIQSGAVVIQGDRAPETTATTVVNRLAQRVAG